eukprot:COSAG02_NODE_2956_length_7669_cov_10.857860_4_plen_178_part_00
MRPRIQPQGFRVKLPGPIFWLRNGPSSNAPLRPRSGSDGYTWQFPMIRNGAASSVAISNRGISTGKHHREWFSSSSTSKLVFTGGNCSENECKIAVRLTSFYRSVLRGWGVGSLDQEAEPKGRDVRMSDQLSKNRSTGTVFMNTAVYSTILVDTRLGPDAPDFSRGSNINRVSYSRE